MVRLKCPKCGYVWEYKGRNPYYATCPRCLRKVSIAKYRVDKVEKHEESKRG